MDLLNQEYRKKIIQEIKGDENVQRKIVSYKKHNMQADNFHQYVVEALEARLDPKTVKEMTVFSNINLQKRISKSEASIYKHGIERCFYINSKEVEELEAVYEEMDMTTKLRRANEVYKYQDQCAIQIVPQSSELVAKILMPHQYDVIPNETNPEIADAYIISNFNNTSRDKINRDSTRGDAQGFSQGNKYRDQVNQSIADWDDSAKYERYYVWTAQLNFVMNGKGEILDKTTMQPVTELLDNDPNIMSPLAEYGIIPFVDVANCKDFEYWVRSGDALYYSTIIFNLIFSSEYQVVDMQGHAQAYYKGDAEHMPENIRIGADKVIFIPVNPNNEVSAEFGFANPGSDLTGIRGFRESWLASFLSSRGLDVSVISGSTTVVGASSGVEKLLQMIEKFDASLEDFSLFKNIENKSFEIIYHWIKSLYGERDQLGELILNSDYQLQLPDFSQASMNVEFTKPQMIKTDMEELDVLAKEIEMGISSRVHALMDYKGMNMDEAKKRIAEIDQLDMQQMDLNQDSYGNQANEERSFPEIQS